MSWLDGVLAERSSVEGGFTMGVLSTITNQTLALSRKTREGLGQQWSGSRRAWLGRCAVWLQGVQYTQHLEVGHGPRCLRGSVAPLRMPSASEKVAFYPKPELPNASFQDCGTRQPPRRQCCALWCCSVRCFALGDACYIHHHQD